MLCILQRIIMHSHVSLIPTFPTSRCSSLEPASGLWGGPWLFVMNSCRSYPMIDDTVICMDGCIYIYTYDKGLINMYIYIHIYIYTH